MSKKDYIAIANAIAATAHTPYADAAGYIFRDALDTLARNIASVMADDNPRFDRARFSASLQAELRGQGND